MDYGSSVYVDGSAGEILTIPPGRTLINYGSIILDNGAALVNFSNYAKKFNLGLYKCKYLC